MGTGACSRPAASTTVSRATTDDHDQHCRERPTPPWAAGLAPVTAQRVEPPDLSGSSAEQLASPTT
jgi:hypothetical protein